ncbi:hypothetical protein [Paenibacillus sp. MMS18-CY102]|uniref:hypothetical protein n=1 Tax=Paenibacillus sp. MMS18-CY102 TaxID=2682849 RepID=UPI0013652889|nr:hypothetical protein [Paenibacillus sp. MMS18-CY102]MWC30376.1 hypothetical protein [Paenibacillus sp. MMS18-CY102]
MTLWQRFARVLTPLFQANKEVNADSDQILALYGEFSKGQQALFAVWTYFTHAVNGTDEFHWRTLYTQHMAGRYGAMQQACVYLGLPQLNSLLHELAAATQPVLRDGSAIAMNEANALLAGDAAYAAAICALPGTRSAARKYSRIAAFIRSSPEEFVTFL